jgi:hypothetical protein
VTKPDASRSARCGTDSVTSEGDKPSSEAKNRVERPLKLFGGLDWIDPSLHPWQLNRPIFFLVGGLDHKFYFAIWE